MKEWFLNLILHYLVDAVLRRDSIEPRIHFVQHVHHHHGCQVRADICKPNDVCEQDGHAVKHLKNRTGCHTVRISKNVHAVTHLKNRTGYHTVKTSARTNKMVTLSESARIYTMVTLSDI